MSSAASAVLAMSFQPGDVLQTTVSGAAIIPGETIPLTGAMTYNVDLAMMPAAGLQGLMITIAKTDANGAPVSVPVRVNLTPGGYVMLPPGGGLALAAPLLAASITGISLVSTANALARVSALA